MNSLPRLGRMMWPCLGCKGINWPSSFFTSQAWVSGKDGSRFSRVLGGKIPINNYRLSRRHQASTCLKVRGMQINNEDRQSWLGGRAACDPRVLLHRISGKHVQRLMLSVTCCSLYHIVTGLSCPEALVQPSAGETPILCLSAALFWILPLAIGFRKHAFYGAEVEAELLLWNHFHKVSCKDINAECTTFPVGSSPSTILETTEERAGIQTDTEGT